MAVLEVGMVVAAVAEVDHGEVALVVMVVLMEAVAEADLVWTYRATAWVAGGMLPGRRLSENEV